MRPWRRGLCAGSVDAPNRTEPPQAGSGPGGGQATHSHARVQGPQGCDGGAEASTICRAGEGSQRGPQAAAGGFLQWREPPRCPGGGNGTREGQQQARLAHSLFWGPRQSLGCPAWAGTPALNAVFTPSN